MNKIVKYSVPKILIPSKFALPLNYLKKVFYQTEIIIIVIKKLIYLDNDYEKHFKK